jgi:hypothetical protein
MNEAITYFENNSKNKTILSRASTAPIPDTTTSTQLHLTSPSRTSSLPHTRSTSDIPVPNPSSVTAPSTTLTSSTPNPSQIRTINLLIPEQLSKTKKDLFLSVRVTASQTLEEIRRGICPHLLDEDIWFSLSDEITSSSSSAHPQEIPLETIIGNISNQISPSVFEFSLFIHPQSSRTLELSVQFQSLQQQPIKLIVKPSQTCRKMMEKISQHFGASQAVCSFTFNRKKIKLSDTFESLGVVNGSVIRMTKK